MTRKDFQLIARVLAQTKCLDHLQRATLAEEFAIALRPTNGGFQTQLFLNACNNVKLS